MIYKTNSNEETINLGKQIATTLKGGDIVLLYGELGAGKTTFTKGLAEGLGVTDEITSPTFTLMNVYGARTMDNRLLTMVHVDTYRLKNEQELINIGIEDYLGEPNTICVIEWPEKISNLLMNKKSKTIKLVDTGGTREVTI